MVGYGCDGTNPDNNYQKQQAQFTVIGHANQDVDVHNVFANDGIVHGCSGDWGDRGWLRIRRAPAVHPLAGMGDPTRLPVPSSFGRVSMMFGFSSSPAPARPSASCRPKGPGRSGSRPRIRKPGEEKIDRFLRGLAPAAMLVRGLGALHELAAARDEVEADIGCRNTVFHGKAQSAAELVPGLRGAGVRRFRIELVRETPDLVDLLVRGYRALVDGTTSARALWQQLSSTGCGTGYGVVRGSLRVLPSG